MALHKPHRRRDTAAFLLLLLVSPVRGALRAPAGDRRAGAGDVTVDLGFGTVSFAASTPEPGAPAEPPGRLKACNRGTFLLRYGLAREGSRVVARNVSVRVRNAAQYIDPPFPRLREHEAMHQRINRVEAARLEKELALWSADTTDLKAAEVLFRRRFRERLEDVQALHKEWDANSVFTEPRPASGTSSPPN